VAFADDRAVLLVVDGAGGFDAASAVLEAVEAALPELLATPDLAGCAARAWAAALAARDRGRGAAEPLLRRPHVAASLAVAAGGTLWCATTGDTAVLRIGRGGLRLVSGVAPHLGHTATLPLPQRAAVAAGDVVVCLTDGFFDGLGAGWAPVVEAVAASATTAAEAADRLVRAAVEVGVADHVTAAVLLVAPTKRPFENGGFEA
jgi:serine/threonine protein phosphatase PrpC